MDIFEYAKEQLLALPEVAPYADKEFVNANSVDYYMPSEQDKRRLSKSLKRERTSSILGIVIVLAIMGLMTYFLISPKNTGSRGGYVFILLFLLLFLVVMIRHFIRCQKAPTGVLSGRAIYLRKSVQPGGTSRRGRRTVDYSVMVWLEDQQKVVLPTTCNQWDFNKMQVGDEVMLTKLYSNVIKVFPISYE